MVKSMMQFFSLFLVLYLLTGCVSSGKYQNIPDGSDLKISTPGRIALDRESIPDEIKLVCSAIINTLRHREETPFVRFFSAAREEILKEGFNYEGFDVVRIDYTDIQTRKSGADQAEGFVEGVFHFEDLLGRRASLYFIAEYMGSPYGITVNKGGVVRLPPSFPEVEAFFVPFDAFSKEQMTQQSYWELYAFALKNGIGMKPSEVEEKSFHAYQKLSYWEKRKVTQEKEKIVVMVFCKDRLTETARFEVAASQGNIKPGYLDKDGWPIAIYAGEFIPDSWDKTFDIMAFYVPEENTERYTVGKFTNRKSYGFE